MFILLFKLCVFTIIIKLIIKIMETIIKERIVNTQELNFCIENNSEYVNTGINIELNREAVLDNKKYISRIDWSNNLDQSNYYSGFLKNISLMKSNMARYNYPNGDIYFGEWTDDKKNGVGLYCYKNEGFYLGNWKKGSKQDNGIQIWKKNDDLEYSDAFLGYFSNGCYRKGLYLSNYNQDLQNADITKNYIYFGEFDDDKTKTDENCFLYDCKREYLFNGDIKKNKARKGYQIACKDNSMSDLLGFKMSAADEDNVEEIIREGSFTDLDRIDLMSKFNKFNEAFIKKDYNKIVKNLVEFAQLKLQECVTNKDFEAFALDTIEIFKENLKIIDDVEEFQSLKKI